MQGERSNQDTDLDSLWGQTRSNLSDYCRSLNIPDVHSKTIFRQLYKQQTSDPWGAASLPERLRQAGRSQFEMALPEIIETHVSAYDRSVKFVINVGEAEHIEAVLMPETSRLTLCVSSQVGCRQACAFCITGRMGLIRNLSAAEIVAQVVIANRWVREHPEWCGEVRLPEQVQVTNVVFMGMGEPLDNVQAVIQAMGILVDPYGLALGLRKISVSTAGHLEGMNTLLKAYPNAALAFSLHAPNEELRRRIMPITRRFSLEAMIQALKSLADDRKRCVLIQYTMMGGVNDASEHAQQLVSLLKDIHVKVNLIPLNDVEGSRFHAPHPDQIQAFRDILQNNGLRTMVRYSKGQDIGAACGQLVDKARTRGNREVSVESGVN